MQIGPHESRTIRLNMAQSLSILEVPVPAPPLGISTNSAAGKAFNGPNQVCRPILADVANPATPDRDVVYAAKSSMRARQGHRWLCILGPQVIQSYIYGWRHSCRASPE